MRLRSCVPPPQCERDARRPIGPLAPVAVHSCEVLYRVRGALISIQGALLILDEVRVRTGRRCGDRRRCKRQEQRFPAISCLLSTSKRTGTGEVEARAGVREHVAAGGRAEQRRVARRPARPERRRVRGVRAVAQVPRALCRRRTGTSRSRPGGLRSIGARALREWCIEEGQH